MWTLIKSLLTKWALFKVLLRTLGSLAWLIPIAFILKAIGLPVLIMIVILGLPIIIVLAIIGLPIVLVLVFAAMLLAGIFFVLSFGLVALKIAIPVMLVVWFIRWLRRKNDPTNGGTASATE
jgi:hypothetical protein